MTEPLALHHLFARIADILEVASIGTMHCACGSKLYVVLRRDRVLKYYTPDGIEHICVCERALAVLPKAIWDISELLFPDGEVKV
jgi:hypothetical protein